jgi:hypothetical protein
MIWQCTACRAVGLETDARPRVKFKRGVRLDQVRLDQVRLDQGLRGCQTRSRVKSSATRSRFKRVPESIKVQEWCQTLGQGSKAALRPG